jgi:hypothetical protein
MTKTTPRLGARAAVKWTFTWIRGVVHQSVTRLASELSPAAVATGVPCRPRLLCSGLPPGG